jgi:hypothetical protein
MGAHSSADARQWIGFARQPVSFLEAALSDQTDVASGIGVSRTRHHAREVRMKPIGIDSLVFESL